MIKRRKKKVDKVSEEVVSSNMAISNSAKSLKQAYKIAKYNKDLDALVAISERWMTLSRIIDASEGKEKLPMGFIVEEEESEH